MPNRLTQKKNTWCSGCGNFGILNAVQKAFDLFENETNNGESLVMTSGIGCHGKIFDYLNTSGFYSLHGRAIATAQGIKLGNPNLNVIMFGGDGDSMGEGLEHTLFAAKRNENITLILHNNGVYGLTTGQFSPLSKIGYKGPSTPFGNPESPFIPIPMILEAGASFVARAYSAKINDLSQLILRGIKHKGFSFIEVLQPCVSFNNTYQYYNEKIKPLEKTNLTFEEAYLFSKSIDPIYTGLFYQIGKPVYSDQVIPENYHPEERKKQEKRISALRKYF